MTFFLFILLIGVCLYTAYIYKNFSDQLSSNKKQLILLKKQNDDFKYKVDKLSYTSRDIKVQFSNTEFNNAVTNSSCNLYIAPLENCPILCKLSQNTTLTVLGSAYIGNDLWYEVLLNNSHINNKGWVREVFLTVSKL